jgi:hypothetical protein
MEVNPSDRVRPAKLVQPLNALSPIVVILAGMIFGRVVVVVVVVVELVSEVSSEATVATGVAVVMVAKAEHPSKVLALIVVMLFVKANEGKLEQFLKAASAIDVILPL